MGLTLFFFLVVSYGLYFAASLAALPGCRIDVEMLRAHTPFVLG